MGWLAAVKPLAWGGKQPLPLQYVPSVTCVFPVSRLRSVNEINTHRLSPPLTVIQGNLPTVTHTNPIRQNWNQLRPGGHIWGEGCAHSGCSPVPGGVGARSLALHQTWGDDDDWQGRRPPVSLYSGCIRVWLTKHLTVVLTSRCKSVEEIFGLISWWWQSLLSLLSDIISRCNTE